MNQRWARVFFSFICLSLVLTLTGIHSARAASFSVTNANDSGAGSLRQAILDANANVDADTITFAADYTITLASQLPAVTTQITITGNGAAKTIIQASTCNPVTLPGGCTPATYRIFEVKSTGNLTLDGLTVRHGNCISACDTFVNHGGGIYNEGTLNLKSSTLSDNNSSAAGGGIRSSGTLTVTDSTISGNKAGHGGGIYNIGVMTVANSTFSGNNANIGSGGGIRHQGPASTVTNSTFFNNSATSIEFGGGIANESTLTVRNSTFSGNSAPGGGGLFNHGFLTLSNTIIANSTSGGDCTNGATISSNINNLVEDGACNAGTTLQNFKTGDPNLGSLADNGGPTQTMALQPGSSAIDAGDTATCAAAPVSNKDQRGVTRPQGAGCDIGAVEHFTRYYVTESGSGTCSAWSDPCGLQTSISRATQGDQIWVAAGTYLPALSDRSASFTLKNGVAIYGGFIGTETLLSQRNPAVNTTLLSGDLNGDDGANFTNNSENSYHVVTGSNTDASAILDGFTITGGNANGVVWPDYNGGGMINYQGSPTLSHLTFLNNYADNGGGGLINDANSGIDLSHLTFNGNAAGLAGGGGMLNWNVTNLKISNSTFYSNSTTGSGGGLIHTSGDQIMVNVTFSSNSATVNGDNLAVMGGTSTVNNTILANGANGKDCSGTLNSAANNLVEATGGNACGLVNGSNGNIIGSDPNLGLLTGSPAYFPLNAGSPAINAGTNTGCPATDQRGMKRPQGLTCDIGAFETTLTSTVKSTGSNDGWVLEATEVSNTGGSMNSNATSFNLGDSAADQQYRAILSFDTSALPDTAVITSAILSIKKKSLSGTDPFTILGSLKIDLRKPAFGNPILELLDFNATAGKKNMGAFNPVPVGSWYSANIKGPGRNYINRLGTTQVRLTFTIDDNDDGGADFMQFFSGNAPSPSRPKLILQYYVP